MRRLAPVAALLFALSGCDTYHFLAGTWREDARKPLQALEHYEAFLARRPSDPRACEVRLRAAELYRGFGRCGEARRHWEAAARDFPAVPACAERAMAGLLRCPDYFPLERGRTWVYGDSASGGRAMRLEWELRRSSGPAGGVVSASLYAGNARLRSGEETYVRRGWGLWRTDLRPPEPILRHPLEAGRSWSARRGEGRAAAGVEWTVVSDAETVKVAAGSFSGCLKVRERDARFPGTWRYDYYCPGVGRVKTSVGGPGFENPNTELLRFDKIPE